MGRLTQLKPRMATLQPRIGKAQPATEAERSRMRDKEDARRALYKTAKWQRVRWAVLVRDQFTCRMCGVIEGETRKLVADHVVPAATGVFEFHDAANLQCLCKACHDSKKQSEDRNRTPGW